ncbi:SDR family NAD(P)-dependent oxidoreductase [Shimazuella alba]|uniref:SDR family oxidoreductase n=1 Tax=Shimazuella alba TaxID=2690964 RepID=A0A6I4VUD6_9BACL|nr:SDR family NAD(P)-dependent oxidoreductase [Shimazuella alba]MXQ53416.1 SDR family oxidoreductase [Shimazuella alba]
MSEKRVAVITGGSSGIGFGIAQKLVRDGFDVTILGRDKQKLQDAVRKIDSSVHWVQADVTDRAEVEHVVRKIVNRTHVIDVLINNAGHLERITTKTPLEEAVKIWDEVHHSNLKGAFMMTMAVAPFLRKPGSRIVNISSIGAASGGSSPGSLAYSSAKAGLNGLTFALARELSPEGVTVNAVAPGFIPETNFFNGGLSEESIQQTIEQIPIKRAGKAEDIAAAVSYLVSPEASFVTGEVLNVNGGWLFGR